MNATTCKKRLAVLWLIGSMVLFVLFLVQSYFGKYDNIQIKAWGWLLPIFMPTLSLMIAVLVADSLTKEPRADRNIDPFMYRLVAGLSTFYLATVLFTILIQPFASTTPLFDVSNLWLAPLQGLVGASLGAFFVKIERG